MKLELRMVSLLARNRERKFTINEIAKSLKWHYALVHKEINRLASEGVIQKETVGKGCICSLILSNEKAAAMLQLSEIEGKDELYNSNKSLKIILEDFVRSVEALNPVSIILFGSYAKGTAAKESDIDILLVSRSKGGIGRIAREMHAKYGVETSIIILSLDEFKKQKGKAIIQEIIKSHYVLAGAGKFVEMAFK